MTDSFVVRAGGPLHGAVRVSGATKNAGTKQMAAALLATFCSDRRTTFDEPVEPDVDSSRARSGWRSCFVVRWRSSRSPPASMTTSGSNVATSRSSSAVFVASARRAG